MKKKLLALCLIMCAAVAVCFACGGDNDENKIYEEVAGTYNVKSISLDGQEYTSNYYYFYIKLNADKTCNVSYSVKNPAQTSSQDGTYTVSGSKITATYTVGNQRGSETYDYEDGKLKMTYTLQGQTIRAEFER